MTGVLTWRTSVNEIELVTILNEIIDRISFNELEWIAWHIIYVDASNVGYASSEIPNRTASSAAK